MPPKSKLSPLEDTFMRIGLGAPDQLMSTTDLLREAQVPENNESKEALNALLRKNLATMQQTSKGETWLKFVGREEAKLLSTLGPEEKLVFDYIRDSGNQGIWTKTLTSRTGLPRTTITKVLKALEGRKFVKSVKSVKAPTRKMYMLAELVPSVELTGGPWFSENELDSEFVEQMKRGVKKCLLEKTVASDRSQLYAPSTVRNLPTVADIRDYVVGLNVSTVALEDEHIEALLEVMVYDGTVERIFVGSRRPSRADISETDDDHHHKRPRRTLLVTHDSDSDSDFDSDEEPARSTHRTSSKKRRKIRHHIKHDDDASDLDASDLDVNNSAPPPDDATPDKGYVYRIVRQYLPLTGLTDLQSSRASFSSLPEPHRKALARPSGTFKPPQRRRLLAALADGHRPGPPDIDYTLPGSGMAGIGMLGGSGAAIGIISSFSNAFGTSSFSGRRGL